MLFQIRELLEVCTLQIMTLSHHLQFSNFSDWCDGYLFRNGAYVVESFTEDNKDASGSASQSWSCAIKRRVTSSEDDNVSVQRRQSRLALAHSWFASSRYFGKEIFRSEEAHWFVQILENFNLLGLRKTDTHKHCVVRGFLQRLSKLKQISFFNFSKKCQLARRTNLQGDVLNTQRAPAFDFHAQVLHQLDLKIDYLVR